VIANDDGFGSRSIRVANVTNRRAFQERTTMRKILIAFLVLPFAQTAVSAQTAGDVAAGKAYWDRLAPRLTDCKDCHGLNGEGGFGPDLAGRGLNAAQILRAARQPWGIMPAFVESQVSEKDAADLAAYFGSLPKPAEPGKWRVEVPAGAPPGQATAINMGCGQCHGATLNGPRGNSLGVYNMNFDEFSNMVYNHTTAMPQYRAVLGQNATNLDMGNFSRARLTEGQLRQIYFWARDEIGPRAPLAGQIAKGESGPSGVTYPVTVTNNGFPGRGVIAEGLTIDLKIPADTTVVAATGTGYQGTHVDDRTKATVATWKLPRSAPKDQEKLTITLSKAATAAANLSGDIRWAKPGPKSGPNTDVVNIAPAPL
jgi:mono/diheme cytochrome c family protein